MAYTGERIMGFGIANTAPLSTFLMTYLDLLRGITDFGIF